MNSNGSTSLPVLLASTLACAVLALALPTGARAACAQWDVGGELDMVQTNGSIVRAQMHRTDTGVQGDARYAVKRDDGAFNGYNFYDVGGSLDGTIDGDALDITIYWTNQTTGVYTGKINAQGRITGTTYDAQHPQTIAAWHSDRTLKCLTGAAQSNLRTSPPKPAVVLGRTQSPAGAAAAPAMSICERARAARARNSPTAAALEQQCVASAK